MRWGESDFSLETMGLIGAEMSFGIIDIQKSSF